MAFEFGNFLRDLREHWSLKQVDVAKDFGISSVVISRYESETVTPSAETLRGFADYYQYDFTDMVHKFWKHFGHIPDISGQKKPRPEGACMSAKERALKEKRKVFNNETD